MTLPYLLLVGLLVLTLCTREKQPTAEEIQRIETVDSLATELEMEVKAVQEETREAEASIDQLLEDI